MKKLYAILLTAAVASPLALACCSTEISKQVSTINVAAEANHAVGNVAHPEVKKSSATLKAVHAIETEFTKAQNAELQAPMSSYKFNSIVKQGVSSQALGLALKAYEWADKKGELTNKRYLTIVDFSLPSTSKRMNVIDLQSGKIVFNELVTQGKGSGSGKMATNFSNVNNSHASVLGAIVTENTYYGKHGYSLRLNGLEENLNSNVKGRAIVVHSANYATATFARTNGRLGTSWGCFALSPDVSKEVIEKIKGGSLIFSYAPQIMNDANYA